MALSVDNNKTYRLRDLRDNAVPRDRSEPRAPSRRPRFSDTLSHPRAGTVVGEFPQRDEKTRKRARLEKKTLEVAAKRQHPRQAVAALMAREGISIATKFGAHLDADKDEDKKEMRAAWKGLLEEAKPEKSLEGRAMDARLERLHQQERELKALQKFSNEIDGQSMLSGDMKKLDARVSKEAGRLERSSEAMLGANAGASSKESRNMELLKKEMAMNAQLNMQYLALQEKLQRGLTSLLSNLLKTRNDTVKNAISGAG